MIDEILHKAYKFLITCKFNSLEPFIGKASVFEYYYAESELYILKNKYTGEFYFIKAKNPKEAYENLPFNKGARQ